jgi:FtsK/SpoIIIE family
MGFRCPMGFASPSLFIAQIMTEVRPERVEKLAGAFAQAAYARQCTITRADNGTLLIELPKPESERYPLPALGPTELPTYSSVVPVGVTPDGSTGWLDLADERHAHLLICGTTGSGKSICLRWLLYRLFAQNSPHALRALAGSQARLRGTP